MTLLHPDNASGMNSVLFICSANICRSPMAMGLFRMKAQLEAQPWRVESAGVWALEGYPAAVNTLAVLKARGIDLSAHQARQVTEEMAAGFHLILTMERGQKEALRVAFPILAGRVYLLSEMIGKSYEIVDPIGSELADFEDTALEMERIFEHGWDRICQLAGG
jgi:protein-tyrosine phosphatase